MLFLPECFGFLGSSSAETLKNAEQLPCYPEETTEVEGGKASGDWCRILEDTVSTSFLDGREGLVTRHYDNNNYTDSNHDGDVSILQGLRTIARTSGLWISGGGMHESGAPPAMIHNTNDFSASSAASSSAAVAAPSRVYNTHIIIDSNGRFVKSYRKIHLFDVSLPLQNIHLHESATTAPGSTLVVCDSPLGRLGLTTCYDLRFPELYTALTKDNTADNDGGSGAEIVLVPSAFTIPTGKAHWHTLLTARAIENQCYVLAAAQYGRHNEKRESYGHSLAIDPWGEVLADAGGVGDFIVDRKESATMRLLPKIVCCDVSKEKVRSVREKMPIRSHREASPFSW